METRYAGPKGPDSGNPSTDNMISNDLETETFTCIQDGYFKEPSRGNYVMKYDVKTGVFSFWVHSHAKIKCPMDYTLYPFDSQTCKFSMKSATKNMTFQVRR